VAQILGGAKQESVGARGRIDRSQRAVCDFNGDNTITTSDALAILSPP